MKSIYLLIERHPNDRSDSKYFKIWLADRNVVDDWLRHFFMLNQIHYNFITHKWEKLKGVKNAKKQNKNKKRKR